LKKDRVKVEDTREALSPPPTTVGTRRRGAPGPTLKKGTKTAHHIGEGQFRDLAEKSLAGIYLIQDEVFQYVNPRLARIFGYTVKTLLAGKGPKHVVFPEDWPTVLGNLRKRLSGEAESVHYEFRGITRKRQVINIEAYGSHTMYRRRPAVIGTLLDITERKRNEELVRKAEEKYRSIFESAGEGIFQTTPEGTFLTVNPALAEMLGYGSPEDLMASLTDVTDQVCVNPEVRSQFMEMLESEGVVSGFDCELYKKDGAKILVKLNAHAVRDQNGAVLYHEGSLEDITDRKRVENEFRLLSEFNKAIIDNAPVAIFTLDEGGAFTSINPALAFLSGLGPKAEEKLIGFNWLKNPFTIQCGLAQFIKKGLKGEPFQLWDFPFMTYVGDRNIYMDFMGVPLKEKNGRIVGLLCIIEETTDRVRTRAKLMQETKLSVIGRLAAGLAHELNNPLGTLVAYSELAGRCLESLRGPSANQSALDKLSGYLKIIAEEAFRCKNVTTDALSLSQKEGLEITRLNIDFLLDNILDFMNIDRSVKIVRESTASPAYIWGDANALRKVFVNLISNAVDATEGRMEATIWIRTQQKGERVLVEVEDNGTGIPDSIADKIFEPFFTTKELKKGIGLGLSLCHDFVTNMGGGITVESKPGCGTVFFVALPAQREQDGGTIRQ
jgi:PAS domain S-box-containing protein